jgi:hypothetical protein
MYCTAGTQANEMVAQDLIVITTFCELLLKCVQKHLISEYYGTIQNLHTQIEYNYAIICFSIMKRIHKILRSNKHQLNFKTSTSTSTVLQTNIIPKVYLQYYTTDSASHTSYSHSSFKIMAHLPPTFHQRASARLIQYCKNVSITVGHKIMINNQLVSLTSSGFKENVIMKGVKICKMEP